MRAAVVVALRVESAALRGCAGGAPVLRVGMGARRMARTAARLETHPGWVSAGLAGALVPGIAAGDLVVADAVVAGEARYPVPSAPLLAGALRRAGLRVHVGTLAASDTVVHGAGRAALARRVPGAVAVDMESGALAALAAGRPFAVVRAVVDGPDAPLLRPATLARGILALRALRAAGPTLGAWAAAVAERRVVLASPRSFCAGVERAVEIVERALARYGAPVYIRRQIVHNAHVVADLRSRGAVFVTELDEVPRGARVVLAAHGVAPAVREQAAERDLRVIDATCPLVAKVHAEVRRYTGHGDTVLLIGHPEHEEVEGTVGEAPGRVLVVPDVAAAAAVSPPDADRVAYVMQTTLAVDEADQIAAVLRERFPAVAAPHTDDICYATSNRQAAVRAVAADTELVLVLGSANSSNSRRLAEVATRAGTPAHLVEDAGAVDPAWLAGVGSIAVTAGASAPPHLVAELLAGLAGLGTLQVVEHQETTENLRFTLPLEVI